MYQFVHREKILLRIKLIIRVSESECRLQEKLRLPFSAPVILGRDAQSVPRILSHPGRCNPSPLPAPSLRVQRSNPPTLPLLFTLKNSMLFNILFLLLCVKKTTVIFTHSKQDAENSRKTIKNIANIKSYCKFRQPLLDYKKQPKNCPF